jgi:hypothetical protein
MFYSAAKLANEVTKSSSSSGAKKTLSTYVTKTRQEFSCRNVNACMLKTFNRMKKRWGFLIYQFVLPALQVGLRGLFKILK